MKQLYAELKPPALYILFIEYLTNTSGDMEEMHIYHFSFFSFLPVLTCEYLGMHHGEYLVD